jgi:lipid A 3-O-deacylase
VKPVHTVPAVPESERDGRRRGVQDGPVTKRRRGFGWSSRWLTAALLAAVAHAAGARDLAAGLASCAAGPLEKGADDPAELLAGTPLDFRTLLHVPCPYPRYLPLLRDSPRAAEPATAGAALAPENDRDEHFSVGGVPIATGPGATSPAHRAEETSRPRADTPGGPLWGVVSELRVGVLAHDVVFPSSRHLDAPNPFRHHFERGANLNGEILFVSPRFLHVILSPRPRVGGSVNTLGYTSNAYVDLDWRYQFGFGPFFEAFLGGAVHNGKLRNANPEFAELGTRFLFHIGLEAGFLVHGRHGLSLFWEHMSNSALAHKNQGMDSTGIRYGYRFAR